MKKLLTASLLLLQATGLLADTFFVPMDTVLYARPSPYKFADKSVSPSEMEVAFETKMDVPVRRVTTLSLFNPDYGDDIAVPKYLYPNNSGPCAFGPASSGRLFNLSTSTLILRGVIKAELKKGPDTVIPIVPVGNHYIQNLHLSTFNIRFFTVDKFHDAVIVVREYEVSEIEGVLGYTYHISKCSSGRSLNALD